MWFGISVVGGVAESVVQFWQSRLDRKLPWCVSVNTEECHWRPSRSPVVVRRLRLGSTAWPLMLSALGDPGTVCFGRQEHCGKRWDAVHRFIGAHS